MTLIGNGLINRGAGSESALISVTSVISGVNGLNAS